MTRDYYYDLDTYGILRLDGVVQNDPWFIDFFFRRLASTANPHYPEHPFVSRCGDEMNYLKPADTPIVFTRFDGVRLYFANSLNVLFHPDRLSYSPEGVLYHAAAVGGRGRIVPQVAMEIARNIVPWGPWYAHRDDHRKRTVPIMPLEQVGKIQIVRPRADNGCVACGEANPHTFFLSFVLELATGAVFTFIRPGAEMQGSFAIVHGGYIALLLDETMGKCLSAHGVKAPTAQLNVRYRAPMLLDVEYEVRAHITGRSGRKNLLRGEIRARDESSTLIADANALFITLNPTPVEST